jgi:zinc dependent phospholipase C
MIDAMWDDTIAPILAARFGAADAATIAKARAYAYGGSVMPDMGYYPFGSRFFTDLLHYTRSGDFVEALIQDARDVNEYAFALGALAHHVADSTGHPRGVNPAVAIQYPKLRARFGDDVTYAEDPKRHIRVEFAFDVVQVARGSYLPQAYRDFIGFKIPKHLVERAFRETYGLEMKEIFASVDLAIGTFRYAVGAAIPQMTQVAWEHKRHEIEQLAPNVERNAFVYIYPPHQYEEDFGTTYRRPGLFARFFVWVVRVIPKVGPFKVLGFRTPTDETEQLLAGSLRSSNESYRAALDRLSQNQLQLLNTDFDTGELANRGQNSLADDTYAELLNRLTSKESADVPDAIRADIVRFYGPVNPVAAHDKKERKALAKIEQQLARLDQPPGVPRTR